MKKMILTSAIFSASLALFACSSSTSDVTTALSGDDAIEDETPNDDSDIRDEDHSGQKKSSSSKTTSSSEDDADDIETDRSSSSAKYVEEADSVVVNELLENDDYNQTNVPSYAETFSDEEFNVSSYTIFFATMDSASVAGEEISFYFDGLEKNQNKYILVYYLPEDFNYNSAAVSGGEATLMFKGLIENHLNEDTYPSAETELTHCQFVTDIDDVIHTGLKWDGEHRQVMIMTPTGHKTSSVLLSQNSGKSLLFSKAPSWVNDAYDKSVGDTFEVPSSTIGEDPKVYFRADNGILVTTRSGEVDRDSIEAVLTAAKLPKVEDLEESSSDEDDF